MTDLRRFQKEPRKQFQQQLYEQLARIEQDEISRSNHTHKEKKDMNSTIERRLPRDEGPYAGLLTLTVAAMMALALAFIIMMGYTSNNSIFTGMFQDMQERQRNVVQVYINQAWNAGDTNRLSDLLTDDHVTTTTLFGTVEGVDGVANLINAYRNAIPDFLYTIDSLEIDGETVWVRGTITGTHTGAFILPDGTEIPPSGNTISIDSQIQFRFEDGDIAEINQIDNTQDLMEQMSAAQSVIGVAKEAQNIRVGVMSTEADYGEGFDFESVPIDIREETFTARRGDLTIHWGFGFPDTQMLNPDWGYEDEIPQSYRSNWRDIYRDSQLEITHITASEDFVAIAFQLDADMAPGANNPVPKGGEEHFEVIHIFRRSDDGRFPELWVYTDNAAQAAAAYRWPEPGD